MNTEQAKTYLRVLGEQLQERQMLGEILLNDGIIVLLDTGKPEEKINIDAYIAYLKGEGPAIERQTGIDAYFKGNGTVLQNVAASIAENEGLSSKWLHDALHILFFVPSAPQKWLEYPGLRVYVAPLEYMLTMNLLIGNGANDENSALLAKKLHITDTEGIMKVVRKYVPEQLITPHMQQSIQQIHFL